MTGYTLYGLPFTSDLSFNAPLPRSQEAPVLEVVSVPEPPPGDWSPAQVEYQSAFRNGLGQPVVTLFRSAAGHRLQFPQTADFYLTERSLRLHLLPGGDPQMAEHYLLGTVFAWCREAQGVPMLHAAVVGCEGGAAAFLASNRGGKTSLAASLLQAGGQLLSDDLLTVERSGSSWVAHAGYPQLRLWPDQARHFAGSTEGLLRVRAEQEKLRVPIHRLGGVFHPGPLPLRALYLPERRPDPESGLDVRIAPAPPGRCLIELVRHSYLARMVEAAGLQPARLALLSRLAAEVPVRVLSYPSGVQHLPVVAEAIRRDLQRLAAG